jgi:hypothetical protein
LQQSLREDNCLPLRNQTPVVDPTGARRGWGESAVDEMIEQLESIYTDSAAARVRAEAGRIFMHCERTWSNFANSFIQAAG